MKALSNERGVVLVVALGITVALAVLSLAIANSGQMSTLTGALTTHSANAFYIADGAAYYALGDDANFVPQATTNTLVRGPIDLSSAAASLPATYTSTFLNYHALPGNLLIRTTDGNVRPAQFGQNDGLGKMYLFSVTAQKVVAAGKAGVDPASQVEMRAAKPGPCADCGS